MAVTILETLMNAEININSDDLFGIYIARDQLHNAIGLLDKGYSIYTLVEPLLEKYGCIENIPEHE